MHYLAPLVSLFVVLLMATSCSNERIVQISTEYGDIKVKLYNETPQHRDNFVKLAKEGFYDSLMFHRVINNFMIQGGDPDSKNAGPQQRLGTGGPGYQIPAEFVFPKYFHKKGALAAARTGGPSNPEKKSSGSQFYIVHGKVTPAAQLEKIGQQTGKEITEEMKKAYSTIGGTPHLDGEYTVFGEIIEGMDVIDKIAAVQTAPGDRPVKDVRMSMKVLK